MVKKNNSMKRIALIIPYFGKWPSYIDLYLQSCRKNQLIDILFVTDLLPIDGAPKNVKFISFTFDQLKERLTTILGVAIPDIQPYKLCDFRPAYGLVFQKELQNYAFWGYGDIDLIYGNLSLFLTPETLNNSDILAFRSDHLHGPFTLFKNNPDINRLFKESDDWKSIFSQPNYYSFDEFGKEMFHTKPNTPIEEFKSDNISVIALKEAKKGNTKLYMQTHSKEEIYKTKDIIVYGQGSVYNAKTKEEYAFYHWVLEKRATWFNYPKWDVLPKKYYISETGFYSVKEFKFFTLISFYRKARGFCYWLYLKATNYIKRRTGKKVNIDTYPRIGFIKQL